MVLDRGRVSQGEGSSVESWGDDSEIAAVVAQYEADLGAGRLPDRAAILERFPQHRAELAECLDVLEFVVRTARGEECGAILEHQECQSLGRLGDFRLRRELGRGGMGVVYEADELSLDRRVALKVLAFASFLERRQIQRFKVEASAAASLKHPNIVAVHATGYDRGVHFYVMELVEGPSLAELIRRLREVDPGPTRSAGGDGSKIVQNALRRWPLESFGASPASYRKEHYRQVARIGVQAADALGHAHHAGVVHRDIKPSNLLLDQEGNLLITDFGLARVERSSSLTMSADRVGTPRYMSPEQLDGSRAVSHLTDIYSLGLTLYELVTLRPAFPTNGSDPIASRMVAGDVSSPRNIDANIPRDLETIILKSVASEPEVRYRSAYELKNDLQRFLDLKPIKARRVSTADRFLRFVRRNPFVFTMLASVFVLLLVLTGGSIHYANSSAEHVRRQQGMLYARDMQNVQLAVSEGRREDARDVLSLWRQRDEDRTFRGFEWDYLWRTSGRELAARAWHMQAPAFSAAFSSDGTLVAVSSLRASIDVFRVDSGALEHSLAGPARDVKCLARIPGTDEVVSADKSGNVIFWDMVSGRKLGEWCLQVAPQERHIHNLAVSPDGKWVAVDAGYPGTPATIGKPARVFVKSREGESPFELPGPFLGRVAIAFSADGRTLVTGSHDGRVKFWDFKNQKVSREESIAFGVSAIAFSPNEDALALGLSQADSKGYDARVEIRGLTDWEMRFMDQIPSDFVHDMAFSHDGKLLALGLSRRAVQLVDVVTGSTRALTWAHTDTVSGVAFSPAGDRLTTCSSDGLARVWSVDTIREPRGADTYFSGHQDVVWTGGFLEGSESVCTVDSSGLVLFWDASTGQELNRIRVAMGADTHAGLLVSPCQRWIAVKTGSVGEPNCTTLHTYRVSRRHDDASGEIEFQFSLPLGLPSVGGGHVGAFSSDSGEVALICDDRVLVVDLLSRTIRQLGPMEGNVYACAYSASTLAVGTIDGDIVLYDAETHEQKGVVEGSDECVTGLAFSSDGSRLLSGRTNGALELWGSPGFTELLTAFPSRSDVIAHVALSPDDRRACSVGLNGHVHMCDAENGERVLSLPVFKTGYPGRVVFSSDGSSILVLNGTKAIVFRSFPLAETAHKLPFVAIEVAH